MKHWPDSSDLDQPLLRELRRHVFEMSELRASGKVPSNTTTSTIYHSNWHNRTGSMDRKYRDSLTVILWSKHYTLSIDLQNSSPTCMAWRRDQAAAGE